MSAGEKLRCSHCQKSSSREGFLKVKRVTLVQGRYLFRGDVLRVECARAAGLAVPPRPAPSVVQVVYRVSVT